MPNETNTEPDEALAQLVFQSQSTVHQLQNAGTDIYERLRRFISLYSSLTTKPSRAALLFPTPGATHASYREINTQLVVGRLAKSARNPSGSDLAVDNAEMSRRHFEITVQDGCYLVSDLQSRNGTYLNSGEQRIHQVLLKAGDIVLAGASFFVFTGNPLPPEVWPT